MCRPKLCPRRRLPISITCTRRKRSELPSWKKVTLSIHITPRALISPKSPPLTNLRSKARSQRSLTSFVNETKFTRNKCTRHLALLTNLTCVTPNMWQKWWTQFLPTAASMRSATNCSLISCPRFNYQPKWKTLHAPSLLSGSLTCTVNLDSCPKHFTSLFSWLTNTLARSKSRKVNSIFSVSPHSLLRQSTRRSTLRSWETCFQSVKTSSPARKCSKWRWTCSWKYNSKWPLPLLTDSSRGSANCPPQWPMMTRSFSLPSTSRKLPSLMLVYSSTGHPK